MEIAANGFPSFAYVFEFTSEKKQKGEGDDVKKWQQLTTNVGRVAEEKEMSEAFRWLEIVKSSADKIRLLVKLMPLVLLSRKLKLLQQHKMKICHFSNA